jgi:pimeloyl-ACP methyl ester carboxylesterase
MAEDRFTTSQDGLKLHTVEYGNRHSSRLPVVCLPGLTRNADDFTEVATALAEHRRVLALDYRGRGRSDYDPNPENYTIPVETNDVIGVTTGLGANPAIFVGTSRGGMIAMTIAAIKPELIAGVVLNDIGPVVETGGILRIKGYVGKLGDPASFREGAKILKHLAADQFPKMSDADWLSAARRGWREEDGKLVATYDPELERSLAAISIDKPFPTLWPQFDAMAQVPVMIVRGENSDILSAETVAAMRARRPDIEVIEVPDQGHAPLLAEPYTIGPIVAFAAKCDAARAQPSQRQGASA